MSLRWEPQCVRADIEARPAPPSPPTLPSALAACTGRNPRSRRCPARSRGSVGLRERRLVF
jgi:hypothetical protein